MKKSQKKYFIIGTLFLICAILSVTIAPLVVKTFLFNVNIENYIYVEIEFLLLTLCGVYYLFSPKYYNFQFITIGITFLFYYIYAIFYSSILNCFKTISSILFL